MILARYLILKICIVVCFVNLGTSMEKGETSSSTQDAAFEIETLLGSDKPIGQQSWKEYIMEIYKDATGIEECKEVLHGENYTDVGAENWNYTRTEDPNLRDLRIIPTSAEATYLLYLDNKGNKPYLGASEFCETYWYRVILMEKARNLTDFARPLIEYLFGKVEND